MISRTTHPNYVRDSRPIGTVHGKSCMCRRCLRALEMDLARIRKGAKLDA